MLNIAFRVDIAKHIGTGHWQRCHTLARYLLSKNCKITFFYRDFSQDFSHLFISDIDYIAIGESDIHQNILQEKDWLGVDEITDCQDFLNRIADKHFDVCIIDHYAISSVWQRQIREKIKKIVVIDDLANRQHDCDILLDQNFYRDYEHRYDGLVSDKTIKLLGLQYSLLRDEFFTLRNETKEHNDTQILVNFGGIAHVELLKEALLAMNTVKKFDYLVITGAISEKHFGQLQQLIQGTHITLLKSTDRMAGLMAQSAFALGACGSTVWERFCLGLNAALVEIADNQAELIEVLEDKDLIDNLGKVGDITTLQLIEFLTNLDVSSAKLVARRVAIQELVDGLGVKKVGNMILGLCNE